ncbi:hypothetical protein EZY14_009920 [Kordia sp. TARA_039_SRF]|jgi:hypothetical protein|nr:hypothetical protein EZY14_009920 [Kordia sp. TARA_039_SRF]
MKKRNLTNLSLNKKSISNLGQENSIKGGTRRTISCQPVGICGIETDDCGTQNCGTQVGCNPTNSCPQTANCQPSISCQPVGIC